MILFVILVSIFSRCMSVEVIKNDDYMGERFPDKYLEVEEFKPSLTTVNTYLNALSKTVEFYASDANYTDINKGIGMFLTHSILKRTLLDDGHKLTKEQKYVISDLIRKADSVVAHLVYADAFLFRENMSSESYRVSRLFRETEVLTHSIGKFTKGNMTKWVKSKGRLNEFLEEMDSATLSKEKYIELADDSYVTYFIHIDDSDMCMSRVIYNLPLSKDTELRPCKNDLQCHEALHAAPSVSYGLSHRMLNMFMYRAVAHCYWVTPKADEVHLEILCAFMYREAVYIARRGYFARDMFLEHIALCGMLGFEELFRQHWFRKAISWMDDHGCMQENPNFSINRTARFIRDGSLNEKELKFLKENLREKLSEPCHNHPMALLTVVLSHAIRYAAHLVPN